jgi:peptidoglycan/xylan/chitin deacetylase (PgdA/CDA1 family)
VRSRRGFLTDTVRAGVGIAALGSAADTSLAASKGERLVVLTFDDAVETHRTFVAPLLKELGFGASFVAIPGGQACKRT